MAYGIYPYKKSWRLRHRIDHGNGKVPQRTIHPESAEFKSFGLRPDMSIEEARAQLQLYKADLKARYSLERRARIEERLNSDATLASAWLPDALVAEFERDVLPGITAKVARWTRLKRLIAEIQIPPEEWWIKRGAIIALLVKRGHSMYSNAYTLKLLNKWGAFYCYRRGKSFSEIGRLTKDERVKLRVAYQTNPKRLAPTQPLLLDHLARAKQILPKSEYLWLAIQYWFGLRSDEVDRLNTPPGTWYRIQMDDSRFPFVLHVLQKKLLDDGHPIEKCWKAIPACEPEQQDLLPILTGFRPLKRPDVKKVARELTLRSGRQGFVREMKLRGYRKHVYSIWLGHLGKETVDQYYEDKSVAYWEPPVKKKVA